MQNYRYAESAFPKSDNYLSDTERLSQDYKILQTKLKILEKENASLEDTISQLRHEISNLTERHKFSRNSNQPESLSYKFHALSSELSKRLEQSGCEISAFTKTYDQAIKALNSWGAGFTQIISSMKTKILPINKNNLQFMHSILDELQNLKAQLTIVQNYIAVLEFNEASLRENLKQFESKTVTSRSVSVNKIEDIASKDGFQAKKSEKFVLDIAPTGKEKCKEDLAGKVNMLKLSNCKLKNQRDKAVIDNERLLLQLKQVKEQMAIAEENAASRELELENSLRTLTKIIWRLKENPKIEELVNKIELELSNKKHTRTRSNIILL